MIAPVGRLLAPTGLPAAVDAVLADPTLLRLEVQPLVGVADGTVVGYEALSRLPPTWGTPPQQFFSAAADRGVGGRLAELVLTQVLELRDQLPERCFLSFNLSPFDLMTPEVRELVATADLSRLVVELTEAAWPEDEADFLRQVALIRDRGGLIAADDVGAGYSGLLQIVRLRPEILKVDRDLVGLLGSDPAAEAVLRMLGELGSALDGWLLAEGVETAEQAAVLARLGIPLAQGWFFGAPAPPWPDGDHLDVVRLLRQEAPTVDLVGEHARQEMPGEVRRGDNGRPVQIRIDLGTGREPVWVAATTLAASTPVRQALMRALNRIDALARSAPLCLTDEAGQLVGVVPVDALARAVATSAHVSVPAQVR